MNTRLVWPLIAAFSFNYAALNAAPNIVVIMADDLGWADIASQNEAVSSIFETPNIDRLFDEGLRFTNGYVANATCGPSRASTMTGRTSSRFGFESNNELGVPLNEILLPEVLATSGYKSGLVGKWHLGEEPGQHPWERGFDMFYGFLGGNHDYFEARIGGNNNKAAFLDSVGNVVSEAEWGGSSSDDYITDVLASRAAEFIDENKEEPFFLYLSFNAPHSPMQAPDRLIDRVLQNPALIADDYRTDAGTPVANVDLAQAYIDMVTETGGTAPARPVAPAVFDPTTTDVGEYDFDDFRDENADPAIMRLVYAAMVYGLDDGVGVVLDAIDDAGIRDNTLVIFLSDNGAALTRPTDFGGVNLPLYDGKGSVFDGGVHVVFGASWPGVINPTGSVDGVIDEYDGILNGVDIFTTAIELAGATVPSDRIIDGVNFMPFLTGADSGNPHDDFFFRREGGDWSLRSGDYKLVGDGDTVEGLFDLAANVSEDPANDISGSNPALVDELKALYDSMSEGLPDSSSVPVDPDVKLKLRF